MISTGTYGGPRWFMTQDASASDFDLLVSLPVSPRLPPKKNPAEPRLCGVLAATSGGDGGIRTLDPGFGPDAPLAGECLRPLGHVSQTFARAREAARRERNSICSLGPGQMFRHAFFAETTTRFPRAARPKTAARSNPRKPRELRPGPARTPCAARARPVPCTSRRSAPRS